MKTPSQSATVSPFARMGDYLSAQMQSNRSFGYGLFVCRMQAAPGPVCSTFWLYSNCPSPAQAPDTAQNWNWNEVDFEFVPYTQAAQAAYATFAGGLPNPALTQYAVKLDLGDSRSNTMDPAALSWASGLQRTDEQIAAAMWSYYNTWMTGATGGMPTGGTFCLTDGSTDDRTAPLDYNCTAADMQKQLDRLNGGKGLFKQKGNYTVSNAPSGGPASIPNAVPSGTTVQSVGNPAGTITLSQTANTSLSDASLVFSSAADGTVFPGNLKITDIVVPPTVSVGQTVGGLGVAPGAVVTAIDTKGKSITMSVAAVAAYSGTPLTFTTMTTGALEAGSATVTPLSDLAQIQPGQSVTAAGNTIVFSASGAGTIATLSVGEAVTAPGNPGILAADATIVAIDAQSYTVTLNQGGALRPADNVTFQFSPVGIFAIAFNPPLSQNPPLIVDYGQLLPAGSLGKVVSAQNAGGQLTTLKVQLFQPSEVPLETQSWWDLLSQQTGTTGAVWPTARDWKYPLATLAAPDGCNLDNAVALNFWRAPAGLATATADLGSWGTITHSGILADQPMDGSPYPDSFTAAVLNNEAYLFDTSGAYTPYQTFHTYTVAWSPTRVAQYIDAPDHGRDISGATPVAVFDITDFPSIAQSGPQAPGGEIPWIDGELNSPIGNVSINFANYVAFDDAGPGPNPPVTATGTLTAGSPTVTGLSSTEGIAAGLAVTGTGIPTGATVLSVDGSGGTVALSAPANATEASTQLTFYTVGNFKMKGTLVAGSPTVTDLGNFPFVQVGQSVAGTGVPAGTTVSGTVPNEIALSAAATADGQNVALTFTTTIPTTGDLSAGSATVTALASTSGIAAGQKVSGPGIASGTTVATVDMATASVTLSAPATTDETAAALVFTATATMTGTLVAGSEIVGSLSDFPAIQSGQTVAGAGIASGTTVATVTPASATMSAKATAGGSGVDLIFSTDFLTTTTTGTLTSGSTTITDVANPSIAVVGQTVTATGLPGQTKIVAVSGTTLTINQAATASGSQTLTFVTTSAGTGWSGPPPGSGFTGVDAYVEKIGWWPLVPGATGKSTTDFDFTSDRALWLDFADGSWDARTFAAEFPKHFGILYAQDYTGAGAVPGLDPLRDSKSPLAVSWTQPGNSNGAMRLSCAPSQARPERNFFVLFTSQNNPGILSADNPAVFATVSAPPTLTLSNPATATTGDAALAFTVATTGSLTEGSPQVSGLGDLASIAVGQSVAGTGVPAGATVDGIDPLGGVVTLSAAATAGGSTVALAFSAGTTASLTEGSATVTAPADPGPIRPGMAVTGPGIPDGTTVAGTAFKTYYAANSSIGTPTAFFAPPAGTSVDLLVSVWWNATSYFEKGQTPSPDATATITATTSAAGVASWSKLSDPDNVLVPPEADNPFRIVVQVTV